MIEIEPQRHRKPPAEKQVGQGGRRATIELYLSLIRNNHVQLLRLGFINVVITLMSELVLREGFFSQVMPNESARFFLFESGFWLINKQVVINACMSFFASILGGVAFFMSRRKNRWYYFMGFGLLNSACCQLVIATILPYRLVGFADRLVFDFFYSATFRFGMFEVFRKPILRSSFRMAPLFGWRLAQDFLLSAVRILIIILMGLSAV